jgi:hypothetical protein
MPAEIVTLYKSNIRDVPGTLREVADEIERGDYGDVSTLGVAVMGDRLEVFGAGDDSLGPSVALLFNAAALRIARAIEEA